MVEQVELQKRVEELEGINRLAVREMRERCASEAEEWGGDGISAAEDIRKLPLEEMI